MKLPNMPEYECSTIVCTQTRTWHNFTRYSRYNIRGDLPWGIARWIQRQKETVASPGQKNGRKRRKESEGREREREEEEKKEIKKARGERREWEGGKVITHTHTHTYLPHTVYPLQKDGPIILGLAKPRVGVAQLEWMTKPHPFLLDQHLKAIHKGGKDGWH